MKFNKLIEIYEVTSVKNDLGGYTKSEVLRDTIKGFITPAKAELQIVEGKVNTVTVIKMFTKAKLPTFVDFVVCDGIKYKVVGQADFKKIRMLNLERVG